ncbi:MAG: hypothetical protein ACI4PW_09015 [Alphaproteobacteria bacterium]
MFFTKDMQTWGSLCLILLALMSAFVFYEWRGVTFFFLVIFSCVYLFMILKPDVSVFGRFDRAFPVFSSYFRSFGWVQYAFCAADFVLSLYGVLMSGFFLCDTTGEKAFQSALFLLSFSLYAAVIVWSCIGSVFLSLLFRRKYGPGTEEVTVRPRLYQHLILAGMIFLTPFLPLVFSLLSSQCRP